jgi:sortase A
VLRTMGRVLIATGLLLFGFAAYQVWGTGIQQARSQDRFAAEFDSPIPSVTSTASTALAARPTTTTAGSIDTSATSTTSTAVTDDPELLSTINAKDGDRIARLEIPSIDVKQIVVSGVTINDLRQGPGHYRNTALPGQRGNSAIAAHRTGFGGPFGDINKLRSGDKIIVSYRNHDRYVYSVRDSKVVPPSDVSVLDATEEAILTLTTCDPPGTSTNRLVVVAVLDTEETTAPVRAVTVHNDAPLDELPAEPGSPPSNEPGSTSPAPSGSTNRGSTRSRTATDAFAEGWFSDKHAAPHVGLWGLALAAISIGAWRVSRRTDRNLIGFAVGIVPFILVLYFFYENLARLLPPTV